jgi:hypothetical protein
MPTAELESHAQLPSPITLADTGLKRDLVEQLMVKALHFSGELTGFELSDRLGLSFPALESALDALKAQRLVEIVGGTSLGPPSYNYRISTLGRERAGMFLDRNLYHGVAPVPLGAGARGARASRAERQGAEPARPRGQRRPLALRLRPSRQRQDRHLAGHRQSSAG